MIIIAARLANIISNVNSGDSGAEQYDSLLNEKILLVVFSDL